MQFDDKKLLLLLQEIKEGNPSSFDKLYKLYSRFLKIEAYQRLRDRQLAEEAVHDVLLSIWRRRADITIDHLQKKYLFGAIVKQCSYKQRSMKLHKEMLKYMDIGDMEYGFNPNPLEGKELGQKIRDAIEKIAAPSSRQAFKMQYIDHKPQKEIAREMNLPLSTIKKKISRAKHEVRKYLRKNR